MSFVQSRWGTTSRARTKPPTRAHLGHATHEPLQISPCCSLFLTQYSRYWQWTGDPGDMAWYRRMTWCFYPSILVLGMGRFQGFCSFMISVGPTLKVASFEKAFQKANETTIRLRSYEVCVRNEMCQMAQNMLSQQILQKSVVGQNIY